MTHEDILTVTEAAVYLRVKRHTLYELIRKRIIPAARVGGHWRVTRYELDKYATEGKRIQTDKNCLTGQIPNAVFSWTDDI